MTSPRSPAPERVNRALQERIRDLKLENDGLKDSIASKESEKSGLKKQMAKDARIYYDIEVESNQTKTDLSELRARLTHIESASANLRLEVASLRERVEKAEKTADAAQEELLLVRKGLTKELGEAAKKCAL